MTATSRQSDAVGPPRVPPLFAALVGLVSLEILVQAVLAAGIYNHTPNNDTWVSAHRNGAYIGCVLALIAAAYALRAVRPVAPRLAWLTVALFVAVVLEVGIGQGVSGGTKGLLYLHIPVGMILFGLTVYLPVLAARGARSRD